MPAALGRCAFAFYLLHAVASQDLLLLEFSENPVYDGSRLSLTCKFGKSVALSEVIMDAFNGTRPVGRLHCIVSKNTTNGTGVFYGKHFTGCPSYVATSGTVNVSIDASPNLELLYNCSVRVSDDKYFYNWTSNSALLQVRVLPSTPLLLPRHFSFNENVRAAIECHSSNGKPPAHIVLTVSNEYGIIGTSEGNNSVSLNVSMLRIRHNATASCSVKNHPIGTTYRSILVNYIAVLQSMPIIEASNKTLNCSNAVASYPEASYSWSSLSGAIGNQSSHNSALHFVGPGQSGLFYCIAINTITLKAVLITYEITITMSKSHQNEEHKTLRELRLIAWLIPTALITLFGIIMVAVTLYWRGRFRKGIHSRKESRKNQSVVLNNKLQEVHTMTLPAPDDGQYQALNLHTADAQTYAGIRPAEDNSQYQLLNLRAADEPAYALYLHAS